MCFKYGLEENNTKSDGIFAVCRCCLPRGGWTHGALTLNYRGRMKGDWWQFWVLKCSHSVQVLEVKTPNASWISAFKVPRYEIRENQKSWRSTPLGFETRYFNVSPLPTITRLFGFSYIIIPTASTKRQVRQLKLYMLLAAEITLQINLILFIVLFLFLFLLVYFFGSPNV